MVEGKIKVTVVPDTTILDKELKKKRTFTGLLGLGRGGVGGIADKGDSKSSKKTNSLLGGILKSVGAIFGLNILFSGLFRLLKPFVELFTALSFLVWFPLWKALKPVLVGLSKFVKNVATEGGGVTGLVRGAEKTAEEAFEGKSIFERIGVALIAGIVGILAIIAVIIVATITTPFIAGALLITAAITAFITLLILAWDPLVELFNIIVQAFKDFWSDMKEAWAITINFFKKMGAGIKNVWNSFIDKLKSGFNSLVEKIKGFGSILKDAFVFLKDKLISTFKSLINGIINAVNSIIPGTRFDIPLLANGGIVTKPTLAIIGERGPEAVIPLNQAGGFGGGMGVTQNISINATINNDMDIRNLAVRLAELSKDELAMSTGSQRF